MPDFLPALISELMDAIVAACPEIIRPGTAAISGGFKPPTLFTSMQALRANVIERMKDGIAGNGYPAPPYVVLQVGALNVEKDFGIADDYGRALTSIYYVDTLANGASQETVNAKAFALRTYIDLATRRFTNFAALENGMIDSSESMAVNRALAADSKVQIVSAMVQWSPGLLVQVT